MTDEQDSTSIVENLALAAIDEWFGDKIKLLSETHHQSNIGFALKGISGSSQPKQAAAGIVVAIRTRDEMRKLIRPQ